MRKGILGSIASVAAGASAAWGQSPLPVLPAASPPPPAAVAPAGDVIPADGQLAQPGAVGRLLIPGASSPPAPVIMPPIAVGPPGDPQGLGPVGQIGPPPGPMWPPPGPYSAPLWQPSDPGLAGAAAANLPPPGGYGSVPHVWTRFDYLMYFAKTQPIRFPLVTTSAPSDQGLLGRPSTLVLVGQQDLAYNLINGGRMTFGFFGDADRRFGFEGSGFVLEQKSNITSVTSSPTGIPTLARPYRDTASPAAFSSMVIANPNFGNGRVTVGTSNQTYSIEANGVWNLYRSAPGTSKCLWSVDFLAGYRFLQMTESLEINSITNLNLPPSLLGIVNIGPFGVPNLAGARLLPGALPFGGVTVFDQSSVVVQDRFLVHNRFNGGQVGLRGEAQYGMWTVALSGKLAVGNMHERLEITGASGFNDPVRGRVGTSYGGLYATSSNIGVYNHDDFAVIPEFNGTVGLALTRGLTAFVGYNFLYVNRLARPATQVNTVIDTSTVPFSPNYGATNRPAGLRALFNQDDFWLMGVNFGFQVRY